MRKRTLFNIAVVVVMILSLIGIGTTIAEAMNSGQGEETNQTTRQRDQGRTRNDSVSESRGRMMAPDSPDDDVYEDIYGDDYDDFYDDDKVYGGESVGIPPEMWRGNSSANVPPEMWRNQSNPSDTSQQLHQRHKSLERDALFFGLFSALFFFSLIYLIVSWKYPTFYFDKSKLLIYLLGNVILVGLATAALTAVVANLAPKTNDGAEQTASVEVNLDETNVIEAGTINLNERDADLTIKNGGSYTLSGNLEHSVVIDAEGQEVRIVLNGATISSSQTAAIVGLAANKITIELAEGTENTLSDGGNSNYDGAIFSNAALVFEGNGALTVNGQQNEGEGIASEAQNITFNGGTYNINASDDGINAGGDGGTITINGGNFYISAGGDGIDSNRDAVINGGTVFVIGSEDGGNAGIDTENGYTINGGTVIALGSDMLETPKDSSKQKVLALTLGQTIKQGTNLALNSKTGTVIAFQAPKKFRTVIISTPELVNGNYTLLSGGHDDGTLSQGIFRGGSYSGGERLTTGGVSSFEVSNTINAYGNGNRNGGGNTSRNDGGNGNGNNANNGSNQNNRGQGSGVPNGAKNAR